MDDKIPEGLEDLLKGIIEDDEKIPEGLDDLLDSVREDSKSSGGGALATIPKKSDDLVDEEIDSQILSILGLEDVFDLTYEEYASLLKEASIKGRMADSQMTTESIELVTNELKRVKGKTGKFKVKPKKVNIDKVFNRKPGAIVKVDSLKPEDKESEAAEDKSDSDEFKKDVNDGINKILGSLITIKSVLDKQKGIEERTAKRERRTEEKREKSRRENKLEKKKEDKKKTKKLPEVKPIGGFFDMIKRFFTNILIGGTVLKIFKWMNDPENKSSIERFKNFMVDNAPLILGGLLAIAALPLVATILGFLAPFTTILMPAIIAAISFLASPAGLFALAGIAVKTRESREINKLAEEEAKRRNVSKDQVLRERQRARNNPLNIVGEAFSSGGLDIAGGGGISVQESLNVDPKASKQTVPQMTPEEAEKYNKQIANLKSGSGEKVNIPGIGSVVAGRNLFGIRETKYFDSSGNTLSKWQWAQRMADAGNAAGAKAAAGREVKPTPKSKSKASTSQPSTQPSTPLVPKPSGTPGALPPSASNTGSVIEYITGDAGHPNFEYEGHGTTSNYHDHIAFKTIEDKERAKAALRSAGIQIGSESRPWDTDSYHSQGLAIDIPGAQWGGRGAIGETEYAGSRKVRAVLAAAGFSGGGIDTSGSVRAPSPSAQIARTPVSAPSISSPTGRSGIGILPMPMGGGGSKGSTSGSGAGQTKLPFFSSEDPNNMTMMVVKGIYNVVG